MLLDDRYIGIRVDATLDSFVQEALNNPGVVYARVSNADGKIFAKGGNTEALAQAFSPDTDPSRIGDGPLIALPRQGGGHRLWQVEAELRNQIGEREYADLALEEARQQTELASEAKSRFLATMSHEIHMPLNAIINTNDLLQTYLDGEQYGYVKLGRKAGRNLRAIVNSLPNFSRINAGLTAQHPEPCDPEELVTAVA